MSGPNGIEAAWDDDRLTAAFRARSSKGSLPPWLVAATVERLRAVEGEPVRLWHRLGLAAAPIAVVVVAVVVAGSLLGQQASRTPSPSPGHSAVGPTPLATPEAASSPTDGPNQVYGLDIISVSEAIAIRDSGRDDREIAVRGWYQHVPIVTYCPIIFDRVAPVQLGCGDMWQAITQDPQRRVRDDGSVIAPQGPTINPSFEQIDATQLASPVTNPRACGVRIDCPKDSGPVSLVAIGHFDDRRAELCKEAGRGECRDRFVVDRLESVDDQSIPTSVFDQVSGNHFWRGADIAALLASDPAARLLSIAVVSGKQNKSLSIEPSLMRRPIWNNAEAVWITRQLVDGRLATKVIVDGTDRVFAVQTDGTLSFVSGSIPTSKDAMWPPRDAIVVTIENGSGHPFSAAVVDLSGHLIQARRIVPPGPRGSPTVDRELQVDRVDDQGISVSWSGGLCDDRLILRVRGDAAGRPDGLFLDGLRSGPCRLGLVVWNVVLDFDQPVEASQFVTQYGIGAPQP